jgi:hypothetical protein
MVDFMILRFEIENTLREEYATLVALVGLL